MDVGEDMPEPLSRSRMILDMSDGMGLASGIPSTVTSVSGRSRCSYGHRSHHTSSVLEHSDGYSVDENESFSQRRGRFEEMSAMSDDSRSVEGLSERSSVDVLPGSSDSSGEGELINERENEIASGNEPK